MDNIIYIYILPRPRNPIPPTGPADRPGPAAAAVTVAHCGSGGPPGNPLLRGPADGLKPYGGAGVPLRFGRPPPTKTRGRPIAIAYLTRVY